MKQLLQLDVLEQLTLPFLGDGEVAMMPFTAKVDSLDYCLYISSLDTDLESLNMYASKFDITIDGNIKNHSDEACIFPFSTPCRFGPFSGVESQIHFR